MIRSVVMDKKNTPPGHYYVAGCGPVAIGQIMAFHGLKMAPGKNPYPYSKAPGYTHIKYDWMKMVAGGDDNAVAVLMYEIGLPINAFAIYKMGSEKEGGAETTTFELTARIAFRNMGYEDPGSLKKYNLDDVKISIYREEPVLVSGSSKIRMVILGIPVYDGGHFWVIDGYGRMATKIKGKNIGENITVNEFDYVHCNLGWAARNRNGWFFNGIFDTNHIPWDDTKEPIQENRSVKGEAQFYQYSIKMLTGIRPINN
jgi:hypothetical protein